MRRKRILSLFIAFAMALSLVPTMTVGADLPEPLQVQFMARDSWWNDTQSSAVAITGNNTYSATVAIGDDNKNIVTLGIRSAGATLDGPGTAIVVPGYEDAKITIDSIEIQGAAATIGLTNNQGLDLVTGIWDGAWQEGYVNVEIWDAWDANKCKISSGLATGQEDGNAYVTFPEGTTSITVNFTVSGILPDEIIGDCPGCVGAMPGTTSRVWEAAEGDVLVGTHDDVELLASMSDADDQPNSRSHLLKFTEIDLPGDVVSIDGASLALTFKPINGDGRSLWVWSDLSGSDGYTDETQRIEFLAANAASGTSYSAPVAGANGIVFHRDVPGAGTSATITIPANMLVKNGVFATKLYIAGYNPGTNTVNATSGNRFRSDLLSLATSATLNINGIVNVSKDGCTLCCDNPNCCQRNCGYIDGDECMVTTGCNEVCCTDCNGTVKCGVNGWSAIWSPDFTKLAVEGTNFTRINGGVGIDSNNGDSRFSIVDGELRNATTVDNRGFSIYINGVASGITDTTRWNATNGFSAVEGKRYVISFIASTVEDERSITVRTVIDEEGGGVNYPLTSTPTWITEEFTYVDGMYLRLHSPAIGTTIITDLAILEVCEICDAYELCVCNEKCCAKCAGTVNCADSNCTTCNACTCNEKHCTDCNGTILCGEETCTLCYPVISEGEPSFEVSVVGSSSNGPTTNIAGDAINPVSISSIRVVLDLSPECSGFKDEEETEVCTGCVSTIFNTAGGWGAGQRDFCYSYTKEYTYDSTWVAANMTNWGQIIVSSWVVGVDGTAGIYVYDENGDILYPCDCDLFCCPSCIGSTNCSKHLCGPCDINCYLHVCTICEITCDVHACEECERDCDNLPHACDICDTECTLHICADCGKECNEHGCEICEHIAQCISDGGHACGIEGCPNEVCDELPHACDVCETECTLHVCDDCGKICDDDDCTICNTGCTHTLVCSQCDGCRDTTCRGDTAKAIVGAACTCGTADCKACDCYILGDLNNDGNINISDALQILMKLARINSSLVNTDTRARRASLVVAPIANPTTTNNPTISDVLQVLMKIAKITSATPNGTIDGRSRNNAVAR